jgi:hypothetical protein
LRFLEVGSQVSYVLLERADLFGQHRRVVLAGNSNPPIDTPSSGIMIARTTATP